MDLKLLLVFVLAALGMDAVIYFGFQKLYFPIYIWMVAIPLITVVIFLIYFILQLFFYHRDGPEGFMFAEARRKNIPVLNIIDIGSNNAKFELGRKDKPDSVEFNNELSGKQVDPTLTTTGSDPTRYEYGLNILNFSYIDWLSITAKNALAYKAIIEYKRERAPKLNWLTDQEFMVLISTPKHHLSDDIRHYMLKYRPVIQYQEKGVWYEEQLSGETVIEDVNRCREEISRLPILPGFFAYHNAFENIPQAYTAQNLEQMEYLYRTLFAKDWLKKINWLLIGFAALLVCVGGGVGVYLASLGAG